MSRHPVDRRGLADRVGGSGGIDAGVVRGVLGGRMRAVTFAAALCQALAREETGEVRLGDELLS
jgi:hypothetical protein